MTTKIPMRRRIARTAVLGLVLSLGLVLAFRLVGVEVFRTHSVAMEPTLRVGDRFVVDGTAFRSDPAPGDVVVIREGDGTDDVKRVIGVPGDRIEIRDDVVFRNGESIRVGVLGACDAREISRDDAADCEVLRERIGERTWRTLHSSLSPPESMAEVTVPPGTVFVLGDHGDRSNDSRNPRVGMVPFASVRRAWVIFWSEHPRRVGTWIE